MSPWKAPRTERKDSARQAPPRPPSLFPGSEEPGPPRKIDPRRDTLEPVVPYGTARRPAWLTGDRPRTIFVECRVGGVIIYPSRRAFDGARMRARDNPVLAEVRRLLPGETAQRGQVTFLVWPEGMRTYHHAYPLLDSLDVPKRRRNLQRGDDVRYLIANE